MIVFVEKIESGGETFDVHEVSEISPQNFARITVWRVFFEGKHISSTYHFSNVQGIVDRFKKSPEYRKIVQSREVKNV